MSEGAAAAAAGEGAAPAAPAEAAAGAGAGAETKEIDAGAPVDDGEAKEGGDKKKKTKRWFPLESNPDVIDAYIAKLGFPTAMYKSYEVLSTEDWALAMVPRPVIGVMMLYPIKEASEKHRDEEEARIVAEGQEEAKEVYFTKQTVGNACGTVALLHAVANATSFAGSDTVPLGDDCWFSRFLSRTLDMTPDERAKALEDDDDLEVAHEDAASRGQTTVPDAEEKINAHFMAFTNVKGHLYELDGRKKRPINHGPTTPETLLEDACKVVRGFMERDPGELRFTVVALAANTGE